jgi:L-ascorbate metabolism protein UlaG (beta-lactamase superfamily)
MEDSEMRIRWLGWAGVEVEAEGERVVVDPLQDAGAVFSWLADRGPAIQKPDVVAPATGAIAGFLTHLHRDHADASALESALSPDATVYEPQGFGGEGAEQLAVSQADQELAAAGLKRQPLAAWTSVSVGPFVVTALPAVDGTGDPQVSWLIAAGDKRVLHLGDTMFHGWWWRVAERFGAPDIVLAPINGARVSFPHRRPASSIAAVMDPEQAALAGELLQADRVVPIHYGAYAVSELYEPVPDPIERLTAASKRAMVLDLGQTAEV